MRGVKYMIDANSTTENFTRRALWAQIDLDAAAHNMRVIRKHVGPDVRIAAVVKANAYGHGAVELARVFAENGADCFAVSRMKEWNFAAMQVLPRIFSSLDIPMAAVPKNCWHIILSRRYST